MWRDVFGFNRAETFGLVILLLLFCVGGGIYLYQKSSETIPAELIFESASMIPSTSRSQPRSSKATPANPAGPLQVNINTAPADSLALLPHVGSVISQRIVDLRAELGGFDSVGQLLEVRGIGAKRLAQLRPYVAVD